MTFWRISGFANLKGEGGLLASARWHTKGRPIVYLSDSPASAMLERLVHVVREAGLSARNYTLLEIEAEDSLPIEPLMEKAHSAWRDKVELTRAAGDRWLAAAKAPLARVPSAVVPRTWNYLLNPLHPAAAKVRILSAVEETFDMRLFESRPR
jgi:RES domain-containing protein